MSCIIDTAQSSAHPPSPAHARQVLVKRIAITNHKGSLEGTLWVTIPPVPKLGLIEDTAELHALFIMKEKHPSAADALKPTVGAAIYP
jgi:hypothetical protein